MRRMMAMAAVAALLLAVAGCERAPRAPRADTRVTFWHVQTDPAARKVIEDAVGRFEAGAADTAVATTAIPEDLYESKLSEARRAGALPDMFHTRCGEALRELVRQKLIADLTESAAADNITQRILPSALRLVTMDGRVRAVPMDVSVVVLWYNHTLFDKAGVNPPATWDEFLAACAKLRASGVIPVALGNRDGRAGTLWFDYLAVRIGGVKPLADAESRALGGTFRHPAFVEAGGRLQELARAGAFNPDTGITSQDEAHALFLGGGAAMILEDTRILPELRSAPQLLDAVDCLHFPSVPRGAGDAKIVLGTVDSAYVVSARSGSPGAALGLIRALTSDVTAIQWGEIGRIPALKADLTGGMIPSSARGTAALLFEAPDIQPGYDRTLAPPLAQLHRSTTQALVAGTMTPEDAALKMEAQAAAAP